MCFLHCIWVKSFLQGFPNINAQFVSLHFICMFVLALTRTYVISCMCVRASEIAIRKSYDKNFNHKIGRKNEHHWEKVYFKYIKHCEVY